MEEMPLSCTWIVVAPPAAGKCNGRGTEIRLFAEGEVRRVEQIKNGDIIAGDDGKPRVVCGTSSGRGQMYRVDQDKGMSYTANGPHILVLYNIETKEIIDIELERYIELPEQIRGRLRGVVKCTDGALEYTILAITALGEDDYFGFELMSQDGSRCNGRFLLADGTVTHNTTLIENFAYYLKHRYPVSRVFIGTEDGYKRFCRIFHPLYVSNYWSEEEEKRHVLRQRTCEMENGRGYTGNYAINILDDISDDPKLFKTQLLRGLFKLGSQHWANLLLVLFSVLCRPSARSQEVCFVRCNRT